MTSKRSSTSRQGRRHASAAPQGTNKGARPDARKVKSGRRARNDGATAGVGAVRLGEPPRPSVEWVRVPAEVAGQRLDNFLLARLKGLPRSLIYSLLRRGEIRVNKGRARPAQRLEADDVVRLPPLRRAEKGDTVAPSEPLKRRLEAALIYEDERVIVVDKPAGLAVHGGSGINLGVIETLRALRPGEDLELVHRLDRDTSGCLLISKRRSALRQLHAQLREGALVKRYLALICGQLPRREMLVDAPLYTDRVRGGERMVRVDRERGKPSRTLFRVRGRFGALTLVEAELDTGRTHQIRVHAAHLGAPIAGDPKYGDPTVNTQLRGLGVRRLFLHAASLSFRTREGGPEITVDAPLPPGLSAVLTTLEKQPWTPPETLDAR